MNANFRQAVRFEDAVLCLDCNIISNSEAACSFCQSSALMSVAKMLGQIPSPAARLVPPEPSASTVQRASTTTLARLLLSLHYLSQERIAELPSDVQELARKPLSELSEPEAQQLISASRLRLSSHFDDLETSMYTTPLAAGQVEVCAGKCAGKCDGCNSRISCEVMA